MQFVVVARKKELLNTREKEITNDWARKRIKI